MTNTKVYQGFHDDKKVAEHWHTQQRNFQLGHTKPSNLHARELELDIAELNCLSDTKTDISSSKKSVKQMQYIARWRHMKN